MSNAEDVSTSLNAAKSAVVTITPANENSMFVCRMKMSLTITRLMK